MAECDLSRAEITARTGDSDLEYYRWCLKRPAGDVNDLKAELLALVEECRALRRVARAATRAVDGDSRAWAATGDMLAEWESGQGEGDGCAPA